MTALTSPQSPSTPAAIEVAPDTTTGISTTAVEEHCSPGRWRRAAVVVTGAVACLLPAVFTVNITRMLVTGVEADHRFHQATGQGLVLTALWLGALIPLVRAGWSGRRPPLAAGLLHLTFVLVGAALAVLSPGGGAPILMAIIAVPGALLWAALPRRPRLRTRVQLDPLLAPVALFAAAVFTPFAIGQLDLQNAATGYHAQNPHYWDMAWMTVTLTVVALLGALLPAARRLVLWLAFGAVATGTAGLAFGEGTSWSLLVLGVGMVAGLAAVARQQLAGQRPGQTR
jgi:hypothetical protein